MTLFQQRTSITSTSTAIKVVKSEQYGKKMSCSEFLSELTVITDKQLDGETDERIGGRTNEWTDKSTDKSTDRNKTVRIIISMSK